jgi:ParB family chromosome partitioning protein
MTQIQLVPLDRLCPSPANARKTNAKDGIEGLANSIHNHGLLNNLVVQPGGEKGTFSVLAGGRRLAALNHLVKAKKLPADWPVPCNVIEIEGDISSEEISLAENEMRQAMHPADQFEAFKKMADEGQGTDTIAAKFGVTPRVVEQRLKLANVSPKLIKIYRDGDMSLEQIMAFSVSTDHKQQEKVWKDLPAYAKEQQRADTIRRAITEQHIPSDNRIVRFVGIEAYEAAGGQVLHDLFSNRSAGAYLTNAALLDKLAGAKLEEIAESVRAEGWKWVAQAAELPWSEENKYAKRQPKRTQSAEQKAEAIALRKQIAALEKQHPEDEYGERPEDIDRQLNDLMDRAEIAEEGTETWTDKDKEICGAIVTIGGNGQAEIKRGLLKPEDQKAAKKEAATSQTKAKQKKDDTGLSSTLTEYLTAHQTAAIQTKLATNPKVALVAVVHALASTTIFMDGEGAVNIRGRKTLLKRSAEDIDQCKASKETAEAVKSAAKGLTHDRAKLWDYLSSQSQGRLLEIMAACTALTFDAVSRTRLSGEHDPSGKIIAKIASALKLDMTDYWQPTADFFERIPAAQIIAAVTEACGKAEAAKLGGMKKGDAAKAAAKMMKGKGWLPAILRGGK